MLILLIVIAGIDIGSASFWPSALCASIVVHRAVEFPNFPGPTGIPDWASASDRRRKLPSNKLWIFRDGPRRTMSGATCMHGHAATYWVSGARSDALHHVLPDRRSIGSQMPGWLGTGSGWLQMWTAVSVAITNAIVFGSNARFCCLFNFGGALHMTQI